VSGRNFWLVVFIWCVLLGGLVMCAGALGGGGAGDDAAVGKGDPDVDLEAVLAAYKDHAAGGAQSLDAFERQVNERGWYTGGGHVSVRAREDGSVLGFVDADGDSAYKAGADKLVFVIEADSPNRQLYARDRHDNRFRIGAGDLLSYYLIARMLDGHRGYYGGWHDYGYGGFHSPGYYRRWSTTRRWGSPGYGSSSGRRTGGGWGRSGGWSGGK